MAHATLTRTRKFSSLLSAFLLPARSFPFSLFSSVIHLLRPASHSQSQSPFSCPAANSCRSTPLCSSLSLFATNHSHSIALAFESTRVREPARSHAHACAITIGMSSREPAAGRACEGRAGKAIELDSSLAQRRVGGCSNRVDWFYDRLRASDTWKCTRRGERSARRTSWRGNRIVVRKTEWQAMTGEAKRRMRHRAIVLEANRMRRAVGCGRRHESRVGAGCASDCGRDERREG